MKLYTVLSNKELDANPLPENRSMNNTEILLIRACKSNDSLKRVKSVYRRFYRLHGVETMDLIWIMSGLVDKYTPITNTATFAADLYSKFRWDTKPGSPERFLSLLIIRIALSEISKFPGFKKSLRWRKAA